jgi:hypothetical protein
MEKEEEGHCGGAIQDKGKGKVEVDMQDPHVSVCGEGELKIAIGN